MMLQTKFELAPYGKTNDVNLKTWSSGLNKLMKKSHVTMPEITI